MNDSDLRKSFEKKISLFNTHFTSLLEICKRFTEQNLKYKDYARDPVYMSLLSIEDIYLRSSILSDGVKKFMMMFERYFSRNANALLDSSLYYDLVKSSILYMADETNPEKSHLLKYNINISVILEHAKSVSNTEKESINELGTNYISSDPDAQILLMSPLIILINFYRILHVISNNNEIKTKIREILNPLEDKAGYSIKTFAEESMSESFSTIYSKLRGGLESLPFISEEQKRKIPDSSRLESMFNNLMASEGTKKFTEGLFKALDSGELLETSKNLVSKMVQESTSEENQDPTTKSIINLISPLLSELNVSPAQPLTSISETTEDD